MLGQRAKRPSHDSVANEWEAQHAAFGCKGPGRSGNFRPQQMGKNCNHIPCLFMSLADVFFTQYRGPVDESLYHLMHELAQPKSASRRSEGTDPRALIEAYPRFFARGR